jgi:hypothetical protein
MTMPISLVPIYCERAFDQSRGTANPSHLSSPSLRAYTPVRTGGIMVRHAQRCAEFVVTFETI